ncbi:MAG: GNAT family N-acetyltransferase [Bacillota bacterium]|nr:GNAT family N-acetyltransferase [Bacillota bacterium]
MQVEAFFRAAGEEDRAAIGAILARAYEQDFRILTRDVKVAAALMAGGIVVERFRVLEADGGVVACVALSDVSGRTFAVEPRQFRRLTGRIKGTIASWVFADTLVKPLDLPEGTGFIEYVTVAEDWRGRGLGRRLLAETLALGLHERYRLTVQLRNRVALGLYRSFGFVLIRSYRNGLLDTFPLQRELLLEYAGRRP